MLTMTTDAAQAIGAIVSSSPLPEGGLRITVQPVSESESSIELSLVEGPVQGDDVVEEAGSQIFVDQTAAPYLEGKVLDAELEGDTVRFMFQEQGPSAI